MRVRRQGWGGKPNLAKLLSSRPSAAQTNKSKNKLESKDLFLGENGAKASLMLSAKISDKKQLEILGSFWWK